MRLNRYLATSTGMSRRAADELISTGNVMINHRPGHIGDQVMEGDTVTIEGTPLELPDSAHYLILNKPTGYVTSRLQQGTSPTIYDLLPGQFHRLKPVGRLDKDSSGLMLLTDDGDVSYHLTHPSFTKSKQYEVTLDRSPSPQDLSRLRSGVDLEDGLSRFDALVGQGRHYRVSLHEGRNRQIRRTFTAVGYTVTGLHRTSFGNISLGTLPPGEFKLITKEELL